MATQEVSSTEWKRFCDRFAELHRGAPMTITKIESDGRRVELARDMPLKKVWMSAGACNDTLFFNFEQEGRREITHQITEPIHIKLREEREGQKGLQIDAEDGTTIVQFRSGKFGELLNEFAGN